MRKSGIAAVIVSGATASIIGLAAPAVAAPSGPGSAAQTISELQADGYTVTAPQFAEGALAADVARLRQVGHTFTRTDTGVAGAGDSLATTVTSKTVYVDVK